MSRPSTSLLVRYRQDVDARHKAGHDEQIDHWRAFMNATKQYSALSFRGDAKHRTRNLEIPRCAIAHLRSGRSDHPGMTASRRQRAAAPAQADILQFGESADHDRLRRNEDFAEQVWGHRA